MSTLVPNFFSINGVISTDRTVMQNVTALCDATGVFLTYDVNVGAWAVVINAPAASSKSFDDSNIIGSIDLTGSPISEMYNSVSFEFPHKDIRDQTDYVELKIPDEDRFPMELDNELTMSTDLINDSAVAQYLAAVELKQSRMDKVITFTTDYTSVGLKAGSVITVTNEPLGFNNKQFRITRIQESEEATLDLHITALEYDSSIYSTDGLIRTYRHKKTGIMPKAMNGVLAGSDAAALLDSNGPNAQGGIPFLTPLFDYASPLEVLSMLNSWTYNIIQFEGGNNLLLYFDIPYDSILFTVNISPPSCICTMVPHMGSAGPKDVVDFYAFVPLNYQTFIEENPPAVPPAGFEPGTGNSTMLGTTSSDWQTASVTMNLNNIPKSRFWISIHPIPTYDINQDWARAEVEHKDWQILTNTSGHGMSAVAGAYKFNS